MFDKNKPTKEIYSPPKTHASIKRTLFLIEISILVLVFIGTIFYFFRPSEISFEKMLVKAKEIVSLKKQKEEQKGATLEEKLRREIDGKILSIISIDKQTDGYVVIRSKEGVEVIISEDKDLDFQVRTLQNLLSKAKIEKRILLLVDFRFEKLVVRYQ